ncbi:MULTISPECIES: hypothetical protein [Streptomyces]|uniref:hypothetical protein n=1 Tax=Streptomyces TaxID=1883 RepID=UPI0013860E3B|nr:hypothetical protein [Streptomyces sp. SID2888]MYV50113.1 hypothetical protein [Streptomyces sp. SID2888]
MNERDVLLNELAHGLRPMSGAIERFDGLGREEQSEMLHRAPRRTPQGCQAGPLKADSSTSRLMTAVRKGPEWWL